MLLQYKLENDCHLCATAAYLHKDGLVFKL